MKIQIPCQQCIEIGQAADKNKSVPYVPSYPYWDYPTIELENWPYCESTCPNGHRHRYTLSNHLYQVLFQQATYCLQDGYYRESILTYHTALERFFEYCTEVLCYSTGNIELFDDIWKKGIKDYSERQFGAYYLTWYITTGTMPELLDVNKVKIRNDVVHKGKLSSATQAKTYGEYIFNYIRNAENKLHELLGDKIGICEATVIMRNCKKEFEKAMKDPITIEVNGETLYEGVGSIFIPGYISNRDAYPSFESCLSYDITNTIGFIK